MCRPALCNNGFHLAYVAPRKLGKIALISSPESFLQEHEIGPDALSLPEKQFLQLAAEYGGKVKSLLMNQKLIAGIGNIYSDEILFQARVHPECAAGELDKNTLQQLYQAMQSVLQTAIKAHVEPDEMPSSFLLPHRAKGERCPRCDTELERHQVSGRSSWLCPNCQKLQ